MGRKANRSLPPGMRLLPAALLLAVCVAAVAHAQQRKPGKPTPVPNGAIVDNGIIFVRVRDAQGVPMKTEPAIALTSGGMGGPVIGMPEQMSQDEWQFQGLQVGTNYEVRVEAKGYQPEQKFVRLPGFDHATRLVDFRMQPTGSGGAVPPPGHFLLAPAAQKEVQQAMKDLKSNKIRSAQKHLQNALKLAPADPGVNYLMGLSWMRANRLGEASPYLEKAVSVDPKHVPALLALGTLHYRQGDYEEAVQVLKQAVAAAPNSWQAHWMLAGAYLSTRDYARARHHAELALKAGKDKASRVYLILGDALERLGENAKARKAFQAFLKRNGHDRQAAAVRRELEKLKRLPATTAVKPAAMAAGNASSKEKAGNLVLKADSGATAAGTPPPAAGSRDPRGSELGSAPSAAILRATPAAKPAPVLAPPAPPIPPPPPANWAPPDVDAEHPAIVSSAACPLPAILRRARRNAILMVKHLQEFSAVEDYQSVEISRKEKLDRPLQRKFNYLVFIQRLRPRLIAMDELRQPSLQQSNMKGHLMGMGSPALALVFHPYFQRNFDWQCEGLGEWKGTRAWLVHFVQSPDQPTSPLHAFLAGADQFLVPLKGRAWVGEKNGQVLHLETDLVKPMPKLQLSREHFAIDYRLVRFRTHRVSLWLPENVNLYIGYRHHYFHNYSRFTHFQLFWVDTGHAAAKPKQKQQNPKQ